MEYVLGITGSSGIIYGAKLLEYLPHRKVLILSRGAQKVIEKEIGDDKFLKKLIDEADEFHWEEELDAPQSSGSHMFNSYIICPASMNTVAKIAAGISDNLITRVASVAMKEKRKFVLVFRETPLSYIHLRNLTEISNGGGIIMPASPGFYHAPKNIDEIINFMVGRILDQIGVENSLFKRWGTEKD